MRCKVNVDDCGAMGLCTRFNLSRAPVMAAFVGIWLATSNLIKAREKKPCAVVPTARVMTPPRLLSGKVWNSVVSAEGVKVRVSAKAAGKAQKIIQTAVIRAFIFDKSFQ